MGLFTDNNERKFLATQTNGEKREVAYRVADDGKVVRRRAEADREP